MIVKKFEKIDEINAEEWDSINLENNLFHKHSFLKTLEIAQVENARLYYLMIFDEDKLIGNAVLSLFEINLDLFIDAQKLTKTIKKALPNLFKTKVLFCGTPISAGHNNICYSEGYGAAVYDIVHQFMEKIAKAEKVKTMIFKEMKSSECIEAISLLSHNYFKGYSLPSAEMNVEFSHFEAYHTALRHNFRRQINASLQKINSTHEITHINSQDMNLDIFYEYYLKVMGRTKTKLEILNKTFFEQFFHSFQDEIKILVFKVENEALCYFVYYIRNEELVFLWTAKNEEKDQFNSYQNLLVELVKIGINNRCKKIIFGQTSYYPKQRLGAGLEERYIYFKHTNKTLHFIFRKLNPWIFPPTENLKLNVFKSKNYVNSTRF